MKKPKLIYQVHWLAGRGYYAYVHCPYCNSSLSSYGKWKRKADDAIQLAAKNLMKHLGDIHFLKENK